MQVQHVLSVYGNAHKSFKMPAKKTPYAKVEEDRDLTPTKGRVVRRTATAASKQGETSESKERQ